MLKKKRETWTLYCLTAKWSLKCFTTGKTILPLQYANYHTNYNIWIAICHNFMLLTPFIYLYWDDSAINVKGLRCTHRHHSESCVNDTGSNGGIDRLLNSGFLKDTSRVVEYLKIWQPQRLNMKSFTFLKNVFYIWHVGTLRLSSSISDVASAWNNMWLCTKPVSKSDALVSVSFSSESQWQFLEWPGNSQHWCQTAAGRAAG